MPRPRGALDLELIDWERIAGTDDADIERQIASDPDTAPALTEEELAAAERVVPPCRRPSGKRRRAVR